MNKVRLMIGSCVLAALFVLFNLPMLGLFFCGMAAGVWFAEYIL